MKKLLVIFGVIFLLIAGCEESNYTVFIKNESSKTVSFIYDGAWETLNGTKESSPPPSPVTSKTYEVKSYTQQPTNIKVEGVFNVEMKTKGNTFTFDDAPSYNLSVFNSLTINVTLKADNYIDNKDSTEIEIKAGETKTAKIYTKTPNFKTDPTIKPFTGDPVVAKWEFKDDTVSVVIR